MTDVVTTVPAGWFRHCALVCVDIQEGETREIRTDDRLPALWRTRGFSASDVNEAARFFRVVALPNAAAVARACRARGLPRLFIHWGCLFADGADVDPEIVALHRQEHPEGDLSWVPHHTRPESRPSATLGADAADYVIPKTGQDAFTSSCLGFVLTNLGVHRLVFVGGHTGACLGRTASAAKDRGYETLCAHDATYDARESTRVGNLRIGRFDHVVSTSMLLESLTGGDR